MVSYQLLQQSNAGISARPLSPSSSAAMPQQRQALTLTLLILLVAFATLLTIIRFTVNPAFSAQTFVPTNSLLGGGDGQRKFSFQSTNLPANQNGAKRFDTVLSRENSPAKFVLTDSSSSRLRSNSVLNGVVSNDLSHTPNNSSSVNASTALASDKSAPLEKSSLISNSDRIDSSDASKVLSLDSKNSPSNAVSPTGVTSLIADQRFEKEYRDDPVSQLTHSNKPRVPKLIFDQSDLAETKSMRIDKEAGCGESSGGYADLLVLVNSAVNNFEARAAIRDTWGKFAVERGAYFYFLLGSTDDDSVQAKVRHEDSQFEDILQGNFYDSYNNLTLKTITMMRWVSERCSNIRYVLKVDDDMMLNMQHICDFAEINPNFHRVIIGKLAKKWKPHRDQRNKWYVPLKAYNGTYFPNFVTGPAYFFTGDAAKPLYETSINDQAPLYLEDVYMTGIVAEKASIRRFNHALMRNVHLKVDSCTFPKLMSSHKHKPNEIRALWALVYSKKCEVKPTKPSSSSAASSSSSSTTSRATSAKNGAGAAVPVSASKKVPKS